jgi:glycosyltransferase involved in cell wall biosynthesis
MKKTASRDLVSVIIPNFNYGMYIGEAIESILCQTYDFVEIVVVDDGSTDDSVERLSDYKGKVRVIETENQGSCAARNLGLLNSKGSLVAYLDADDYWDREKIEIQVSFLKETNADLVFCEMRSIGDFTEPSKKELSDAVTLEWFFKHPSSTPFSPSSVLMTRGLAAKAGSWNTSLTGPAEDFDYFRKCAKFGTIRGIDTELVFHRQHRGSLTAIDSKRYFEDNLRVVRLMFVEDRAKLSILKRLGISLKVRKNYLKHSIKSKNFALFYRIFLSFLGY